MALKTYDEMTPEEIEQLSDIKLLNAFFGRKEGQKLTEFSKELGELSPEDKAQLVAGLRDGTLNY